MSAPASTATPAALHAALLQYLTQLQAAGAAPASNGLNDAEPLEVAIQCITEATAADAKNAKVSESSATCSHAHVCS